MRIWKYALGMNKTVLSLPKGSIFLSVATVEGVVSAWAMVNETEERLEDRCILLVGTGDPIVCEEDRLRLRFMGTCVGDYLVYHVFEVLNTDSERREV